jgi:tRNA (cmo5U34)-methyltransferase
MLAMEPDRDNLTAHKASAYDQKVRQTIPFYDLIHGEVIRLAKTVQPNAKVWVDTGCGTGYLVQRALTAFPQTRFILADPSEAMLGQARARLDGNGPDRLTILPSTDSAGLPSRVQCGTADVVTAIQCHHYLQAEGRRQAVQACFDLLVPGGLFAAFENVAPSTPEGVRIALQRWKAFQVGESRPEEEVDKHLARYGTEFFSITIQQHLELLRQTEFSVVELFWLSQMQAGFYGIK